MAIIYNRILLGNVKGPQGEAGPQGPQGEPGGVKGFDVLWTNTNPTDTFYTQSITIENLRNYTVFLVMIRAIAGVDMVHGNICYVPPGSSDAVKLDAGAHNNAFWYTRPVTFYPATGEIYFGSGQYWRQDISDAGGQAGYQNDTYAIPTFILGLAERETAAEAATPETPDETTQSEPVEEPPPEEELPDSGGSGDDVIGDGGTAVTDPAAS